MAEPQPSKLMTRVRFPLPAPVFPTAQGEHDVQDEREEASVQLVGEEGIPEKVRSFGAAEARPRKLFSRDFPFSLGHGVHVVVAPLDFKWSDGGTAYLPLGSKLRTLEGTYTSLIRKECSFGFLLVLDVTQNLLAVKVKLGSRV